MKKNPTKIALVTGAARGIGRAIASEFLAVTEGPEKAIRRCIDVNGGHFMP
jgi:NAD(P)-dependent dehydrogenase (short-subunit alcohol dehydrogenase family)